MMPNADPPLDTPVDTPLEKNPVDTPLEKNPVDTPVDTPLEKNPVDTPLEKNPVDTLPLGVGPEYPLCSPLDKPDAAPLEAGADAAPPQADKAHSERSGSPLPKAFVVNRCIVMGGAHARMKPGTDHGPVPQFRRELVVPTRRSRDRSITQPVRVRSRGREQL